MTEEHDAPQSGVAQGADDMARIRARAEKYGVAYAAFGEAFQGRGVTMVTRLVGWFILASAVGVVVLAVLAKFG